MTVLQFIFGLLLIVSFAFASLLASRKKSEKEEDEVINEQNPARNGNIVRLDEYEECWHKELSSD